MALGKQPSCYHIISTSALIACLLPYEVVFEKREQRGILTVTRVANALRQLHVVTHSLLYNLHESQDLFVLEPAADKLH